MKLELDSEFTPSNFDFENRTQNPQPRPGSETAGVVCAGSGFGVSISLNVHFHQLYLDGVNELDADAKPADYGDVPLGIGNDLIFFQAKITLPSVSNLIILRTTTMSDSSNATDRNPSVCPT